MSKTFSSKILPWDDSQKKIRVAVIGDLILDEYLEGNVNRISPEAPVPVHNVNSVFISAGGAANTALNIQKAGGQAVLFGIVGKDYSGSELLDLVKNEGVDVSGVIINSDVNTIKKTRISAQKQQLIRIDWEKIRPITEHEQNIIIKELKSGNFDSIVLSDYGKGLLSARLVGSVISIAKTKGVVCVIDPKGSDYMRYAGATLITPNRKEAMQALGLDTDKHYDKEFLASEILKKFNVDNVLVTLGAEGMYFMGQTCKQGIYLPARAREVYDVSGAGDTVVAIMALALGSGCSFEESMFYANTAAGKVVEKWGTKPIEKEELELEVLNSETKSYGYSSVFKIQTLQSLKEKVMYLKSKGKKIVFTNGCFDILHAGHVSYLEKAKSKGDVLIVGINSDNSIKRIKGYARPVVSASQRMRVLASLWCVDYVVEFDEDTPENLIKHIQPHVLIKGADWDKSKIVGANFVESYGGSVETIEYVDGISTTNIIEKIKSLNP